MKMRLQILRSFVRRVAGSNQRLTAGQILRLPYEKTDEWIRTARVLLLPWHSIQRSSESVSDWLGKLSDSERDTFKDKIRHMRFDGGLSTDEFKIRTIRGIINERIIKGKCDLCARVEGCLLTADMRKDCGGAFDE